MIKAGYIQNLILILIGIFIPGFVVWQTVFPHFSYQLNKANGYGIRMQELKSTGGDFIIAPFMSSYPVGQIDLQLDVAQSSNEKMQIHVAKDYAVNALPIGSAIDSPEKLREYLFFDNPTDHPNGTLFSNDKSVFVISKGKYFPFISPEVFEGLGYHWDNVISLDSELFSKLEPGDKMNFNSQHPDGTILKTTDGLIFLVWDGQRLPIEDEDWLADFWKDFYWINIKAAEPQYYASCQAAQTIGSQIQCSFSGLKDPGTMGNSYIFKLNSEKADVSINNVNANFETAESLDSNYLRYALGQIKNKLHLRYAGIFL